jgi:hypothetical protein
MSDENELNSQIADELSDAIRATDAAYDIAVEAWGENDSRSEAINSAWAEVETAFKLFNKETK